MESQLESIDISSIRAAALRPIEESEQPQADLEDPSSSDRLRAIQHAFQRSLAATSKPHPFHRHQDGTASQPVIASESLPYLPSTVPDSQAVANVEQILQEIPNASVEQVMGALKKMSSPHDTQPMTPGYIGNVIKARQSQRREQETGHTYEEHEIGDTRGTVLPGDEGYIEFSSYIDGFLIDGEEEESEPIEVDFSPTQHVDTRLSQFPESQRFKTPATAGKKRNYNGDFVESPALPRNPLARIGQPTPGRMMGLSQAFAATQAPSSPFVNGIPSELRSDLPSPAVAIQMRPNTATDSSPLLALPLPPRRSTEPQTKYISMEESQALRDAQRRKELEVDDESNSDSSFDETPTSTRRRRVRKQRDEEAQRQFDAVARHTSANVSKSSPIRGSRTRSRSSPDFSPLNAFLHPDPTSPPDLPEELANVSEAETDQEDEADLLARHSSQMRLRTVPEEDKENAPQGAVQIPETAALHRIMNGYAAEVEASPSIRHSLEAVRSHPGSQRPDDAEPFVVANSQPSQVRRYVTNGPKLASSGEQTDFVPQSQYPSNSAAGGDHRLGTLTEDNVQSLPQQNMSTRPNLLKSKSDTRSSLAETAEDARPEQVEDEDEDEEPPRRNLRSQPQTVSSTVPETSSAWLQGDVSSSTNECEPSKSMSEFETAPTHPPASSADHDHDSAPATLPSQARIASPTRVKRKRMTDIDAEESQPHSTAPDLGELSPILKDPEFRHVMGSSSPIGPGRRAKRRRLELSPMKGRHTVNATTSTNERVESMEKENPDGQEPRTTQGETPPTSSDDIQAAIPKRRSFHRPNGPSNAVVKQAATYGKGRKKLMGWDIQGSPEEPTITRSAPRALGLRKLSSTLPPAKPYPGVASVLPRAASQHRRLKDGQDTIAVNSAFRLSRGRARVRGAEVSVDAPETISETLLAAVIEVDDHTPPSGDLIAPNQVLACFNGKARAYYPAACLGVSGGEPLRYQIQWDGYEPDEIDAYGLRSLDLRHGDTVKINLEGFPKTPHVIRGFKGKAIRGEDAVTDVRGYKMLLVVQKQRRSLLNTDSIGREEIKEVPVSAIYLDSNMWNQMKDRAFTYIPPQAGPSSTRPGISTPIDRPSTPSTPSSRSRRLAVSSVLPMTAPVVNGTGIFANMGFAISYDNPTRKNELTRLITSNGGLVLNLGFHELFQRETMQLISQYENLGFTALLADKHSRKEKYLQALALGLPCLSGKWLEACIATDSLVDWQSYLLPAGESEELEGAIKSRLLSTYDLATVRIADVLKERPNILNADFVVFVLGRGKAEDKRRPYVFLTQAIGARNVEIVTDLRAAKVVLDGQNGSVKWVFVDDRDVEGARGLLGKQARGGAKEEGVRIVGNEFVKQSLVLGRLYGGIRVDSIREEAARLG